MINFLKKPIVIILFILVVGSAVGGYFLLARDTKPKYDVAVAKRMDLLQEVSVTGRVKPANSVELAFEKGGKVYAVYAKVGDNVLVGQKLAILENWELSAQVNQAQASVEMAEAQLEQYKAALEYQQVKLLELKRGARIEEIKIQETKVANAKIALEDAKNNIVDKLQDAYTKSDDAIRNKVDQLLLNPQTGSHELSFQTTDSQLKVDIESRRMAMNDILTNWNVEVNSLTINSDLYTAIINGKINLDQIKTFLERVALAVNNPTNKPASTSQTIWDGWKSDVATARTNINTAISNISSAEEKLRTAESNLRLEENNLALKTAGTIEEQILAQEAQIKQAEANISSQEAQIKQYLANVNYYRAMLAKTIIYAPISGTITKQDAKAGQIVSANVPVISLMSVSQFEIEADMPEADIAKVQIGNTAKTTLDAYGNDVVFDVKVVAIDPAETIIDGVATYKVTFQFTEKDERVKSGMTASIDISTEKRENVITIPQRAVIIKDGEKFVRVLENDIVKEIRIVTGLRGSDGNIEVISGLKEGDSVIIFFE